jgi:PAS domain S-box-containing protein
MQTGEAFFSDRYYTMLGYEPGEFPASLESSEKLVHPDDLDGARRAMELYLSGEADDFKPEFRLKTKEGRSMWILARGEIVTRTEDGSPLLFMGTHTDIDERVRVEAERENAQKQLIEAQKQAIQELSTPVIPVMDRILVMPLVGSIDSQRARHVMRTLLTGIRAHRARVIILDITGVPIVDSGVANHLNKTIQAARLKGAQTIITGVSDAVAEAIVDLGIDWQALETLGSLQAGLIVALEKLGIKLSKE